MSTQIDFTRQNNDVNGNPRYAFHFLAIVNDKDRAEADRREQTVKPFQFSISHLYDIAVQKAKKIGGKKYHCKAFGGGIIVQSYNLEDTEKQIQEAKNI